MKTRTKHHLQLTIIAAAIATAFAQTAHAQDADEVTRLIRPSSEVSAGVGYVSKDNQRFGQYSGLRKDGVYGLADIGYVQRDDATGRWLTVTGRNLGFDSRELRFDHNKQGDWGYFLDFSQIPRFDPYTINTGLAGIGSASQTPTTIVPGTGADYKFKTERERLTLGFDKALARGLDLQLRFRNEEKDGSRQFGLYSPLFFLAEPIDWTTRQWEATLNYASDRLQLSGGYYGSSFDNRNPRLDVAGAAAPAFIALPPGNEAHHVHLSGGYNFTKTTRGTFKVARARATQDDAFITPALNGQSSLDGRLDTTLVQLGVTSRPLPKLSLLANLRYEDRDDKTPRRSYLSSVNSVRDGFNNPRSIRSTSGKLEASYGLPMGFRLTGGAELDRRERSTPEARSVPYRKTTDETTYRVEVRRSLAETLNGALSFVHDDRKGSTPLRDTYPAGTAGSNVVMPFHWNDRKRDKWRLSLDWIPTEKLALNAVVEDGEDKYRSFDTFIEGLHTGESRFYSLDATYSISDAWQASAWVSRSEARVFQGTRQTGTNAWTADLRNIGDSYGFGASGNVSARLQVGADAIWSYDRNKYEMAGTAVTAQLPEYYYRLLTLRLFAKYQLEPNSGIRADFVHDRRRTDDWTWANWLYPDGTTVMQNRKETVSFIGISYYYRW